MPPTVQTDKLTKRFGKLLAVDDISITVEPGEVYGLLGCHTGRVCLLLPHPCGRVPQARPAMKL